MGFREENEWKSIGSQENDCLLTREKRKKERRLASADMVMLSVMRVLNMISSFHVKKRQTKKRKDDGMKFPDSFSSYFLSFWKFYFATTTGMEKVYFFCLYMRFLYLFCYMFVLLLLSGWKPYMYLLFHLSSSFPRASVILPSFCASFSFSYTVRMRVSFGSLSRFFLILSPSRFSALCQTQIRIWKEMGKS